MASIQRVLTETGVTTLPSEIVDIIMSTTGEYKKRQGTWVKQISRDRIHFLDKKITNAPVRQPMNGRNVWSAFVYLGTPGNAVLMKQHDKKTNKWVLKYNKVVNNCVSVTITHEIK